MVEQSALVQPSPTSCRTQITKTAASFDKIDVLILAQIDAGRVRARSIGVGAMQVEHTGLYGCDRHRDCFARGEIGDDCL